MSRESLFVSLSLLAVLLYAVAFEPASAFDRGGESMQGMGGGFKGVGGMGGGFKGVGGMGGGFKGVGGMGGGYRGVGGAGGGFGDAQSRYHDYYNQRYGENSTRYGENSTRYGENSTRYGENSTRYGGSRFGENSTAYGGSNETTTRYGETTGRYGEPVDQNVDNSLMARAERSSMYSGLLQRIESARNNGGPESNAIRMGAGSVTQRLRALEAHPPTSFNHLYVD